VGQFPHCTALAPRTRGFFSRMSHHEIEGPNGPGDSGEGDYEFDGGGSEEDYDDVDDEDYDDADDEDRFLESDSEGTESAPGSRFFDDTRYDSTNDALISQEMTPRIIGLVTGLRDESEVEAASAPDYDDQNEDFVLGDGVEFDWKNIEVDPESLNDELRQYVTDHFPDAVFPAVDSEDDLSIGRILNSRLGIGESEEDDEDDVDDEDDDEDSQTVEDDDDDEGIDYHHPRHQEKTHLQPVKKASQESKAVRSRKGPSGGGWGASGGDKRGRKKESHGAGQRGGAKQSQKASNSSLKEVERRHKVC
jgi:hypothetical protein